MTKQPAPAGSGRSAFAATRHSVKRLNSTPAAPRRRRGLKRRKRSSFDRRRSTALSVLAAFLCLALESIRALDDAGLLGRGLRVIGTHALYAYEAAAGIFIDPGLTTTEDIDLLFDSRAVLRFVATGEVADHGLIGLLKRVDRSFERTSHGFRAANDEGYLVDLVKPLRDPPWDEDRDAFAADKNDLTAMEIEGWVWLENAPSFEAMAIDERGAPLNIVTVDPRAFAAHKLWVSRQSSRDPVKRIRDDAQARAVAKLVTTRLEHLDYRADELEMLPQSVFDAAASLFSRETAGE